MDNRIETLRTHIDEILLHMTDPLARRCAYSHLYGVSQACALIALHRGENVELATMAGMLHDISTYKNGYTKNHGEKGAVMSKVILNQLGITTATETELICTAIHNHSAKGLQHSTFDEVLKDADVMQHCLYNLTVPIMAHEKERFYSLAKEFGFPYNG